MKNTLSRKPDKKMLAIFIPGLLLITFLYKMGDVFLINISPSMPVGIYKISDDQNFKRNDIVAACLNDQQKQFGLMRGYLITGQKCQNTEPVVKDILAVPGDGVVLTENNITVNHKVFDYHTLAHDSRGRALPSIARGNYFDTAGYWLIGTHDKKSWDSRYWGYVSSQQLLYKLTPVLIWQ
jgi:conjugative transfer signal peptidase TraF